MRIPMTWTPIMAAVLLGGCAGFSKDGGFDAVARETHAHLRQDVRWTRTEQEAVKSDAQVALLLQHSLSDEDAVQIALLNNSSLQAAFEELGLSEADVVESGRLPNPQFTLRHASASAQYDIEETLSFNVLSLLAAPTVHEIEKRRFAEVQSAAVIAVLQLANDTRRAFFAAVAARESVHYLEQVQVAAEAGAELARRMVAAGNWNLLDQAREQGFDTDATQRLTRARQIEDSAQQKLRRLMGPAGSRRCASRTDCPNLPQDIEALPDLEQGLQNRIDLRLQRMQIDELARSLKVTKATASSMCWMPGPPGSCRARSRSPTNAATRSAWSFRYSTVALRGSDVPRLCTRRRSIASLRRPSTRVRRFSRPIRCIAPASTSPANSVTRRCPRRS
jgi:outer membrane protein TolC